MRRKRPEIRASRSAAAVDDAAAAAAVEVVAAVVAAVGGAESWPVRLIRPGTPIRRQGRWDRRRRSSSQRLSIRRDRGRRLHRRPAAPRMAWSPSATWPDPKARAETTL